MEGNDLTGKFDVDLVLYFNKLRALGGNSFVYLGNYVDGDELFHAGTNSGLDRMDLFYDCANQTCVQTFGKEDNQERKVEIEKVYITGKLNSRKKSKKFLEELLGTELKPMLKDQE